LPCSDLFFFQAEDGIRDLIVTGVQTCALPISRHRLRGDIVVLRLADGETVDYVFEIEPLGVDLEPIVVEGPPGYFQRRMLEFEEIGRASCRERVWVGWVGGFVKEIVRGYVGRL